MDLLSALVVGPTVQGICLILMSVVATLAAAAASSRSNHLLNGLRPVRSTYSLVAIAKGSIYITIEESRSRIAGR